MKVTPSKQAAGHGAPPRYSWEGMVRDRGAAGGAPTQAPRDASGFFGVAGDSGWAEEERDRLQRHIGAVAREPPRWL